MTQTRIDWKLVLLSLLAILLLSHAVTAGFPEDWAYRKQFTLTNSSSALTDYQIVFTVYRSTGTDSGTTVYVGTKCQDDYDDIRFTDSSGTVLSCWIESSSSSSATIWVKFPSIPAGSSTWYLYYGNASATAVSNGDATFLFFDDFTGSSIDKSKWTIETGSPTISGGICALAATSGSNDRIVTNSSYGLSTICRMRWKTSVESAFISHGYYSSAAERAALFCDGGKGYITSKQGTSTTTPHSNPYTSYATWEIRRISGSAVEFVYNNGTPTTVTTNITTNNIPISLRVAYSSIPHTSYFDWVAIRKYASTEPTISSWGSEETPHSVVYTDFYGTPTSGEIPLTVYFTDTSVGTTIWSNVSFDIDYWEWNFGDGSPKSYQQNPVHAYTTSGLYSVNLTSGNITYSVYNTTTKIDYIHATVSPGVPVADFTAMPTCGNIGDPIYFFDTSTGLGLYAWNWSFGDGTYSNSRNTVHQYSSNGTYNVSLTVWGAYGSDTKTRYNLITIPCATPTPIPTPTPTPTGTPPIQGEIPQARIPVLGFMVLAWIDLGLMLYTFIDNENRNYMHVYSAVIAVILSFFLSVSLTNGFITEPHVLTDQSVTVNSSVMSTYLVKHVEIVDTGLSWFFGFIGVMMLIICILAVIEAVRENTEEVI